ncbi:hypothetical protein [Brevibacillus panacihumi]|uniref:hypothetical protein n=1 Tax=Brevibacillus panacihumi TaxID=497735 RepID=UPI001606A7B0|nr:hypothetical protein [Brevibacillus panacihumi]
MMTPGFIAALVIVCLLIIWVSIWVTNKAYSRKPDTIDPVKPLQTKNDVES